MSGRWGGSERDREKNRAEAKKAAELTRDGEASREAREAAQAQASNRPTVVQLDGLVLLKIINHSKEAVPDVVSGHLLGLDVVQKLEVTNCFPYPSDASDSYTEDMMRHLSAVNVDNNTVGWYQSAYLGTFFDQGLLEAQYSFQKLIPNSVVVVYDPFQTSKGRLVLKAFRLSDEFMKLYSANDNASSSSNNNERGNKSSKFSWDEFNKLGMDSSDIFQSVPIKVHNSHLVHGFLYELREEKYGAKKFVDVDKNWSSNLDRLSINYSNFLEKNLTSLGNAIDFYSMEQSKFQYFLRQQARVKQQQTDYLKRRALENEARIAQGKEPFPEEDVSKLSIFKQVHKPSRLETYLLSNQIGYYADSIANVSEHSFQKLYLMEALQKKQGPAAADATTGAASSSTPQ